MRHLIITVLAIAILSSVETADPSPIIIPAAQEIPARLLTGVELPSMSSQAVPHAAPVLVQADNVVPGAQPAIVARFLGTATILASNRIRIAVTKIVIQMPGGQVVEHAVDGWVVAQDEPSNAVAGVVKTHTDIIAAITALRQTHGTEADAALSEMERHIHPSVSVSHGTQVRIVLRDTLTLLF